jgi:hypothetical protein
MKARFYDARLTRFLSRDPIGLAGGTNPYLYANANPLFFIDPNGLAPESDPLFLFGASPYGYVDPILMSQLRENSEFSPYFQEVGFAASNFMSFATGLGPAHQEFGPEDIATKAIRESPGIQNAINAYVETGQTEYHYPYSPSIKSFEKFQNTIGPSINAHITAADSPVELFVGGYRVNITSQEENQIGIQVTNDTSLNSLLYHAGSYFNIDINYGRKGNFGVPFSTVTQQFNWTQGIK